MITIFVADTSAHARNRMIVTLEGHFKDQASELQFLPRFHLKPITLEELKFNAAPEILLIGPELLANDMVEVARIRKELPNTIILACPAAQLSSLTSVEHLVRLGVDDVCPFDANSAEFVRKLIVASRRRSIRRAGVLVVVDSSKGGVGVTSVVAGLAESIALSDKKVCLVDLDASSQDLSRFLQARPFLNENLQLLIENRRPISEEHVEQCISEVATTNAIIRCVPPPPENDDLYNPSSSYPRTLLSVVEVLDSIHDFVIVDLGNASPAVKRLLHRVADFVLFVTSNDPASIFSAVDALTRISSSLSPEAQLLVLENSAQSHGLKEDFLRDTVLSAAKLSRECWMKRSLPFSRNATLWPASGSTLFSLGSRELKRAFNSLTHKLGVSTPEPADSILSFTQRFLNAMRASRTSSTIAMDNNSPIAIQHETNLTPLSLPTPDGSASLYSQAAVQLMPPTQQKAQATMQQIHSNVSNTNSQPSLQSAAAVEIKPSDLLEPSSLVSAARVA